MNPGPVKASGLLTLVIGIAIAAIIAAAIIPTAGNALKDVSTSGWSAAVVAVWGLLIIGVVLCVALAFFKYVT